MTNKSPEEKPLRTVSFMVHATRGVIRDHNTRRKTMFMLLVAALVLLFSGSTFLQASLNSRAHPGWFIFFWLTCAWLSLTAMLLPAFDFLIVKIGTPQAKRPMPHGLETPSPGSNSRK